MSEVFFLYVLCKGCFCAYTRVKRKSGESFKREQGETERGESENFYERQILLWMYSY